MKFIAFYLPQFHRIKENDEWWGKGFTDWDNVKKAKKYFDGHRQPRIPFNNYYYDLSKTEDIKKQAEMANKYGVYGFCFYHYWFEGKLLLETPVDLLLKNKDINLNYCFSWANETWARTWDGKNRDILIKQKYGEEKEWEEHFRYFVKFFEDERYIKVNNKPMLLIYKKNEIPNLTEMIRYWQKRAKESGFDGLHLVDTLRDANDNIEDSRFVAHAVFEPAKTLSSISKARLWLNRIRRYSINLVNKLLKTDILTNKIRTFAEISNVSMKRCIKKNTYPGVFMGWDNSPRKKAMSTIIMEPTEGEFDKYVSVQVSKVKEINDKDNQFIFVNAWNEWAEGTYLEPDTEREFTYLKIIQKYVD